MISIVYVSSAKWLFTPDELRALLEVSRRNNGASGVTGILLYRDGNFMQVLEGELSDVRAVHDRISADPRHGGMMTLLEQEIDAREFPDWSMAFRDLSSPEVATMEGFSEFLNSTLGREEFSGNSSRVQRLLMVFRRSMR